MVASSPKALHIKSPLLYSPTLSNLSGHSIYLKLDCLQPSGSFKIRGVGASVQAAFDRHGTSLHVVSSSGGNAGLAASTASRILGVKCTVFCPLSTPDHMVQLFRDEGAEVKREGKAWDHANTLAMAAVEADPAAVLVHPFQGDDLVRGNSTLIDEMYDQLEADFDITGGPDVITSATGGGGLLSGLLTGTLRRHPESTEKSASEPQHRAPLVVSTQCFGADSFSQSVNSTSTQPVTLDAITSRATSMGALTCSSLALDLARRWSSQGRDLLPTLKTVVMDDTLAAGCSWRFARDHRLLIELSCGAALLPVYFAKSFGRAIWGEREDKKNDGKLNIVVVVCGGSKDTLREIYGYAEEESRMEAEGGLKCRVEVNGQSVQ